MIKNASIVFVVEKAPVSFDVLIIVNFENKENGVDVTERPEGQAPPLAL